MKKYLIFIFCLFLFVSFGFTQEEKYISEGDSLFQNGEYKAARKIYKKALKPNKQFLPALRRLSELEMKLESWGDLKDWSNNILKFRPSDLDANYYNGIAHRETGKFKATVLRRRDFGKAEKYFEAVINQDSLHKDVLLQRALLKRRREKWQSAILYGHRQIKVKPDLPEAQIGLFKLYRLYLIHGNKSRMLPWFEISKSDWAIHFTGEYFRKHDNPEAADSVFQTLLNSKFDVSRTPTYLALVRLSLQLHETEKANAYYFEALDSIQSKTDALFLFEDVKYILTAEEHTQFFKITEIENYKIFFLKFWLKRELIPAASVSYRLLEHYERMLVAERQFWYDDVRSRVNNPDKFGVLDFPAYYKLNEEFNDKGLIYIRHGAPNDIARTSGASVLLNESWLYHEREDRDKFVFHFLVSEYSMGNNWRLSSALDSRTMLEDRLGWDHTIRTALFAKSELDFYSSLNIMAEQSMGDVTRAMASDFHTWSEEIMPLETHYHFAYFQGDSGKTEAKVYIALPLNRGSNGISTDSQNVEFGSAIVDENYGTRQKKLGNVSLVTAASAIYKDFYMKNYSFHVTSGAYNFSYFVKDGLKIGGENIEVEVPAFSSSGLDMSSIVPAFWIEMPDDASNESSILEVVSNPSKEFNLADPVFLYYEVYNLSINDNGETDYSIESKLSQTNKKSGIKNLFGLLGSGTKKVVSLNDRRTGSKVNVNESISFDVSNLDKGEYELEINIVDNISKRSTLKTIPITLTKK